jgi:hypothetical protein
MVSTYYNGPPFPPVTIEGLIEAVAKIDRAMTEERRHFPLMLRLTFPDGIPPEMPTREVLRQLRHVVAIGGAGVKMTTAQQDGWLAPSMMRVAHGMGT